MYRFAHRRWTVALAIVAMAVAAIAAVTGLATGTSDSVVQEAKPPISFLTARGWTTVTTGATSAPQVPTAIAANRPLAEEDGPTGAFPLTTIGRLGRDDVVIYATLYPGRPAEPDVFRSRTLPLSLADGTRHTVWELQPETEPVRYLILAAVDAGSLDVRVHFAKNHSDAATRAANEELSRLVLHTSEDASASGA